eukprot:7022961-Pyramimonas_sp.AAC.1
MHDAVVVEVGKALQQLLEHTLDLPWLRLAALKPHPQRAPRDERHLDVRPQRLVEHLRRNAAEHTGILSSP